MSETGVFEDIGRRVGRALDQQDRRGTLLPSDARALLLQAFEQIVDAPIDLVPCEPAAVPESARVVRFVNGVGIVGDVVVGR